MYASKTSVSADRSQAEIKKILTKYGATAFAFAETHSLRESNESCILKECVLNVVNGTIVGLIIVIVSMTGV